MKKICIIAFLSLLCCVSTTATAQVGIKTNLLGWATASPNLGLEWGFGRKSTLNVSGSFNPFEFNEGKQWKHWLVQPEYRYWFCEKFNGVIDGTVTPVPLKGLTKIGFLLKTFTGANTIWRR